MNRAVVLAALTVLAGLTLARPTAAHCEIPCGIYGDETRITLLREHVATVEKSMREIARLRSLKQPDWNQIVRWVNNKERHAEKIQHQVAEYWLHQRIKPLDAPAEARQRYLAQLELLHRIQVRAMKAKQTTDLAHVSELRTLIDRFEGSYFGGKKKAKK